MTYRELYDQLKSEYEKILTNGKFNLTSETTEKSSLTFKKDSDILKTLNELKELAEKEENDAASAAQGVAPSNYLARVYFHG